MGLLSRDGHIHTPLCPHGSKDTFEQYVELGIESGRTEMTFTEHFPVRVVFTEEAFQNRCNLQEKDLEDYITKVRAVQSKYQDQIKINLGFEVDYIEGLEIEITSLLNQYGEVIEDGLLSVHFVKWQGEYYGVDYLPHFEALLKAVGSIEKVYELYFETVYQSIRADLGQYKPKRLGHPTLIRLFNKKYPNDENLLPYIKQLATMCKAYGYELDFNVAGLRKEFCLETYPDIRFIPYLQEEGVRLVLGSDSHEAKDIKVEKNIGNRLDRKSVV